MNRKYESTTKAKVKHFIDIKDLCNPDQKVELKKLMQKLFTPPLPIGEPDGPPPRRNSEGLPPGQMREGHPPPPERN